MTLGHYKIHEGESFGGNVRFTLPANTTINVVLHVPADYQLHLISSYIVNGRFTTRIYEDPTLGAFLMNLALPVQRNRTKLYKTLPVGYWGDMYAIVATGNLIYELTTVNPKNTIIERSEAELVLGSPTWAERNYLIRYITYPGIPIDGTNTYEMYFVRRPQ
jgi:hypothetical protein